MNRFSKPSFSSTLLHRMRSLFECFITQDIQLIDFNKSNVPYLFNHDYDELNQTDQSSDEGDRLDKNRLDNKKINQVLNDKKANRKLNDKSKDEKSTHLYANLSNQFNKWSIKNKEKYVDELTKSAIKYIELADYERAETISFELLDILFYNSMQKNVQKAIETLNMLDTIYTKMNRYLELIEVNKLIANISSDNEQIRKSLDTIVFTYKKMNLDSKAKRFLDEFNRKN